LAAAGATGTAADMTLADVVRLNFYARDVDELFKQFSRFNERFGDSRYATTVLGAGNYQHGSSSCWRQPPLTECRHLSRDVRERRFRWGDGQGRRCL